MYYRNNNYNIYINEHMVKWLAYLLRIWEISAKNFLYFSSFPPGKR
jgi:hypothetical protein